MGRLVKLIGSGIGLASEAIAAHKAEKAERAANPNAGEGSSSSQSSRPHASRDTARSYYPEDDPPPQYAEVTDQEADQLIAKGKAVPVDSKDELRLAQKLHNLHDDDDDDETSEEGDEEQWDLDDAIEAETPSAEDGPAPRSTEQIIDGFMRNHPPPTYTERESIVREQLPCPVIIPQRRPRDKKRGFVRAYAPVLADCGIDQATFLEFLKSFHQSSREDPWLNVVNLAAAGAGFAPSAIAMGVSIAVQFAVGVAMEVQRRTRTNSFLDRMNAEFFKPRGLYCLIITYKPDASSVHETLDINKAISNYITPAEGKMKAFGQNMRLSSGKTYGEMELPEAAPLIFPALDRVADDNSAEGVKKQTKLKSTQKFVSDYFDRRAQAQYAAENPGSSLAAPTGEKQFASRYSDPNHPANSGSLVSLITGGVIDPRGRKQQRRGAKRVRRAIRRGEVVTDQTPLRRGGRQGIVKRMLKKDVLYLMIVNLPSEEELQAGKNAVRNEQSQQQQQPRPQYQQQYNQDQQQYNQQQYHQQQYEQHYQQQQQRQQDYQQYEQEYKQQFRQQQQQHKQ